jgi:hypothetical protein
MVYYSILAGSLIAYMLHSYYIKKHQLSNSKLRLLYELPLFLVLVFGMFYLSASINNETWPSNKDFLPTLGTGIGLGVFWGVMAVLLHASIRQITTDKFESVCLFKIKDIRFFPLNSLVYCFAGLIFIIAAFFTIEFFTYDPDYAKWVDENTKIWPMDREKNYENKTDYPLIKVKGTDLETDGDVKILVLGDSFVFGYGYTNFNYMWWNQLSNELKTRGYNCNVYGVGYEAASTYSELQWLTSTSMVADLEPDIIMIGYVTNDVDQNYLANNYISSYGTLSQALKIPSINFLNKLFPTIFSILDYKLSEILGPLGLFSNKIGYQYATWEMKLSKGEHLAQYNSNAVKPLGDFAASIDIPIILVTTPHVPSISYFEPRYTPILPLFEQAGIKTYNMLYDFVNNCSDDKYKDHFMINPADPHPGTASTWFYSRYVADVLEADYPHILGQKTLTGTEIYNIKVNDWMPFSINPQTITESSTSAQYIISYPDQSSSDSFLTMPANENYVKLSFKYPVDITTVTIEGQRLDSATLYVTAINDDLGFDDQVMHKLGEKSGRVCEWSDSGERRVTSLCVHADTSDGLGDNLTVTISCRNGGAGP